MRRHRTYRRATDAPEAPSRVRRWIRDTTLEHDVIAARVGANLLAWALVLRNRLREILWEMDPSPAELGFSGLTLFLGGDLVLVPHVFRMAPAYAALQFFAGERAWGALLVAVGAGLFVGVVFEQPRTRTVAHLAGLWLWLFVSYCFGMDAWRRGVFGGWSVVLFPLFAVACAWMFARVPVVRWRRRPTAPHRAPRE